MYGSMCVWPLGIKQLNHMLRLAKLVVTAHYIALHCFVLNYFHYFRPMITLQLNVNANVIIVNLKISMFFPPQ